MNYLYTSAMGYFNYFTSTPENQKPNSVAQIPPGGYPARTGRPSEAGSVEPGQNLLNSEGSDQSEGLLAAVEGLNISRDVEDNIIGPDNRNLCGKPYQDSSFHGSHDADLPKTSQAAESYVAGLLNGFSVDTSTFPDPDTLFLSGISFGGYCLKPHQVQGVQWMIGQEAKNNGGILADEVGLGKTLQIYATMEMDMRKNDGQITKPTLVVGNNETLITQLRDEAAKFLPMREVRMYHGPNRGCALRELLQTDIIFVTYGVLRTEHALFQASSDKFHVDAADPRSAEVYKDALFRMEYRRIVLDEAHEIRNRETKGFAACYALRARLRWCLTGTPLQNTPEDIYSLLSFLRITEDFPDWTSFYAEIESCTTKDDFLCIEAIQRLRATLSKCLLRRKQDDRINGTPILDLPPFEIEEKTYALPQDEQRIYDRIQDHFSTLVLRLELNTHFLFVMLLRMRQAVLNPQLLLKKYTVDVKELVRSRDDGNTETSDDKSKPERCDVCGMKLQPKKSISMTEAEKQFHVSSCREIFELFKPTEDYESQRVKAVLAILLQMPPSEKAIIFSSFTSMLDILQRYIVRAGKDLRNFRCVRFDGSMGQKERRESLRAIREDPEVKVLLMSLRAGGVGLNLAQCNHVILVDLWWNPAVEKQAIGRAYRIGQTKKVKIYKMIAEDTIETRILELQKRKSMLAEAVLGTQLDDVRMLAPKGKREQAIKLITGKDWSV
ncbi:hypothetical protein VNI00_006967 [Paramarasmius palmivorus]|uniref:Uncharacterized protein n=1 Tax=Paramarasmius palmivorus TaxID=297713 RepID=A0AAW0D2Q4_9AGAR